MTSDLQHENYLKYRGKCKQMSEDLVSQDPSLRLVCGFYYCPMWNREEEHWWCVDKDGRIIDPSRLQYPSAGMGSYREYDGTFVCDECGKTFVAETGQHSGRYHLCSTHCFAKFVGVD